MKEVILNKISFIATRIMISLWFFQKIFKPHERHMAFSIAHYPSMKLLLNICMETKTPKDLPLA